MKWAGQINCYVVLSISYSIFNENIAKKEKINLYFKKAQQLTVSNAFPAQDFISTRDIIKSRSESF
jgi:hypothetical protein